MNKVILNLAQTLDGYICRKNGAVDYLPEMADDLGDDFNKFVSGIDVIVMGRQTYEEYKQYGFEFLGDAVIYVWTRRPHDPIDKIIFYTGTIKELLSTFKAKTIWCFGGTKVIDEFMKFNLIDEYQITTVPYLLGEGKQLFVQGKYEQELEYVSSSTSTNMVTTIYRRK